MLPLQGLIANVAEFAAKFSSHRKAPPLPATCAPHAGLLWARRLVRHNSLVLKTCPVRDFRKRVGCRHRVTDDAPNQRWRLTALLLTAEVESPLITPATLKSYTVKDLAELA